MELKDTLLMPKTAFEMRGNLVNKEPLILKKWEEIDLYRLMMRKNRNQKEFILHDGPPYANGDIHSGHMLNRYLKDFIVRMKSMQGFDTPFIFGWDTHGLPIENQVTKSGVKRKEMAVSDFRKLCEEYALVQVERQKAQIKRLGVIGDFDNAYLTLTKDYEADELTVFRDMALKGLIYRGKKPVHWSPSSETALAEAEIEYFDVKSHAIYVTFTTESGNAVIPAGTKFMVWTTTPWTLPANLALSVHPLFTYGLYTSTLGKVVILPELVEAVSEETGLEFTLMSTFKGKELEHIVTKHPLFARDSVVICGEHVTSEAGTGIVHTAPGHGIEDFVVGQRYGLDVLCPVDEKGVFTAEAQKYAGMFYESANTVILDDLKAANALVSHKIFTHSYPHDWRTGKPLIFRATPQWFASIEPIRADLLKEVKNVSWHPKWGEGRMTNMIKDRLDWTISRQRVWGVPIPIIYHEDGSPVLDKEVFDKIIEEVSKHGSNIWFTKDANYFIPTDYKNVKSPNQQFSKEVDIMDVWFDSGTSALHTLTKHDLSYPADLYLEGNDQYRGWFNSSLTVSVATKGSSPYKSVLTHGFVVDEKGEKMSKSKGNVLDPMKLTNELGADILRLWTASVDYQEDVRLSKDILKQTTETYRKIRNTFKFMLGNLPGLEASEKELLSLNGAPSFEIDRLLYAKTNDVIDKVIKAYNAYDFSGVLTVLINFITNDLSSFYLDFAKDILYCEAKDSARRLSVVKTINYVTKNLIPLIAPILSFTAEEIYSFTPVLKRKESVHLLSFPDTYIVDKETISVLDTFYDVRREVYLALEKARQEGVINSNQEATVTISKALLDKVAFFSKVAPRELARYFIVSEVVVGEELSVKKHPGHKCPRCWNYYEQLVEVSEHHVCDRCSEVISEAV